MFVILLLLALMVPATAANAAEEVGTLTIRQFRVEDYANLSESTGQRSDLIDVPSGAQVIEGVEFTLEKLLVSNTDARVTISTPVDSNFPAKSRRTNASGEARFEDLPKGYYLVTQTPLDGHSMHDERFVVCIPNIVTDSMGNETTTYDVFVYPKGQRIMVEKSVNSEKQVVGIGDIITWDVWYPLGSDLKREEIIDGVSTTSYGKNFYLTDEMDSRLDYVEESVTFRYYDRNRGEIELTLIEGVDYHLSYDAETHILTIRFTDNIGTKKVADAEVAFIEMKLDTRVNASALDTVEALWNNARISFEKTSGDPYEHEVFPPGTNPEDSRVPKAYLGQIVVTKVDAKDTSKRLAGATFYLADSRENAQAGHFLTRSVNEQGSREEIKITTDSNGQASIRAIGSGTYYLVETNAPEGYTKLTEPVEVTVANNGRNHTVSLEITNTRDESGGPLGTGDDASGGKDFAGSVKTGDVVRMTGILLLVIASSGIVLGILRREKRNDKKCIDKKCIDKI